MRLKEHEVCQLVLCNNGNDAEPIQNNSQSWSNRGTQQTWTDSNKYYLNNVCDNVPSSNNLNANLQRFTESLGNATTGSIAYRENYTGGEYEECGNIVYPYIVGEERDTGEVGTTGSGGNFYTDSTIYEAATLEDTKGHGAALSVCSEASPMDSLLEYVVARSCSSSDASPQDEDDRPFDQSDSEELSDANLHPIPRGIVNPNYPGFQHLAHTLEDYPNNSEIDCTDEDFDTHTSLEPNIIIGDIDDNFYESFLEHRLSMQHNNNIVNNNENDEDYSTDPLNPLDSTANLNLAINDKENNDITQTTDSDTMCYTNQCNLDEGNYIRSISTRDIIGDFGKEIEEEIGEIVRRNSNFQDDLVALQQDIHDVIQKPLEETLNNISDVVNQVIERIVIDQAVGGYQQWLQPVETKETIETKPEEFKNDIVVNEHVDFNFDDISTKMADAFLSNAKDVIQAHVNIKDKMKGSDDVELLENNKTCDKDNNLNETSEKEKKAEPKVQIVKPMVASKEEINTLRLEKDIDSVVLRKKEKSSHCSKKLRRESSTNATYTGGVRPRDNLNRRSLPVPSKKSQKEAVGLFDVYNIETAMPHIDLDAIESHLKAAREEERRRRNDREEIRRRLAMGAEQDDYYMPSERPGRKPSLQSRLQSGMNLQICFMNDTASDTESPGSDTEAKGPFNSPNFTPFASKIKDDAHPIYNHNHPYQTKPLSVSIKQAPSDTTKPKTGRVRPSSLSLSSVPTKSSLSTAPLTEADFFARQARLQAEARMALAQAKEMARLQMEIERQKQQISPITEMLRASLQKAGIPLSPDRRRVSRQLLTDMNVAQLQIIVNELHTQIENLNDQLVQLLMARDELHMGQDSMLVDIEDLTRYLGAKEQSIKLPNALASSNSSDRAPTSMPVSSAVPNTYSSPVSLLRPKLHRIASLVKK